MAAAALRAARRPVLIAGGGVHYSLAEDELRAFVERHDLPVVETMAGKACLTADHRCWVGPVGVTGCDHANRLVADADVVLAVGTRLQDFTTGSWTVFGEGTRIVALNAARFDATKHLLGSARRRRPRVPRRADGGAGRMARRRGSGCPGPRTRRRHFVRSSPSAPAGGRPARPRPTRRSSGRSTAWRGVDDLALTSAGGLPGEMNVNWLAKGVGTFDCEYGYSTHGLRDRGRLGCPKGARRRER